MRAEDEAAALHLREALAKGTTPHGSFREALARVPPMDRDAWLDRLWRVEEIPDDEPNLPRGCVPYLPCPVDVIVAALELAEVEAHDVFIDVGAGLGRVVLVARLMTGADCIGIEVQPGLVRAARERCEDLAIAGMSFVEGDALELLADVPRATVFFFYAPFGGRHLERTIAALESHARRHPIRICCVYMPELRVPWLRALSSSRVELSVYRSR